MPKELSVKIDTSGLKKLVKTILKRAVQVEQNIMKALIASGYDIKDEAKNRLNSGSRSGELYKYGSREHIASDEGQYPKSVTGNLANSINVNELKNKVIIGVLESDADYAGDLEDPTKLNRPFLYPSYKKLEPKIKQLVDSAIKGAF